MSDVNRKWFYLIVLSLIWGTSYILIKKSLEGFNPVQLGVVRILITALFLFLIGFRTLRNVSRVQWKWIAISGMVGSFFPVFLFAFAQTEIDIIIVTGRSAGWVEAVANYLPIQGAIAENGGLFYDR